MRPGCFKTVSSSGPRFQLLWKRSSHTACIGRCPDPSLLPRFVLYGVPGWVPHLFPGQLSGVPRAGSSHSKAVPGSVLPIIILLGQDISVVSQQLSGDIHTSFCPCSLCVEYGTAMAGLLEDNQRGMVAFKACILVPHEEVEMLGLIRQIFYTLAADRPTHITLGWVGIPCCGGYHAPL